MDCPRCGLAHVDSAECPRCGVVVAKARHAPFSPRRAPPEAQARPSGAAAWLLLAAALGVAAAAFVASRGPAGASSRGAIATEAPPPLAPDAAAGAPSAAEEAPPVTADPAPAPTPAAEDVAALVAAAEAVRQDRDAATSLAARIGTRGALTAEDVRLAEGLYGRYPEQARGLLLSALFTLAQQERAARRYAEASRLLERAVAVDPRGENAWRGLVAVRTDAADWPAVEAAARGLLEAAPNDAGAARSLAYALVRQDRTREAIEVLASWLDGRQDAEAAALLDRLRREQSAEGGFDERRLAHFHVRYDGEAHEDVGREILRVLDRHYAALRIAFDHEPKAPIPVTLFSQRSYFDATGAPAWSGGEYDHYDGRIRVPIGGLTASLTPELEKTLLHEVTHAFASDLSAGLAPREVQEGLAQWTEGDRSSSVLGDRGMRALADGRIQGVTGFYLASLVLVEELIAQRGRSGINDLLAAMARTGDVDAAFQEVYGRSYAGLQAEVAGRLRQRHGS